VVAEIRDEARAACVEFVLRKFSKHIGVGVPKNEFGDEVAANGDTKPVAYGCNGSGL
jgi:hypothetical protein